MKLYSTITLIFFSLFSSGLISHAALLTDHEKSESVEPPKKTLRILNWFGFMDPKLKSEFTEKTNISLQVDTFRNDNERKEMVFNSEKQYDLVVVDASLVGRLVEEEIIQSIPYRKIPNTRYTFPRLDAKLRQIPKASKYSMNYAWGTTGIVYNKDLIYSRLPKGESPNSLSLIFNPRIAEKFLDCGIGLIDDPEEVIAAALAYANIVPDSSRKSDLHKAEDILMSIKPYVKFIYKLNENLPFYVGKERIKFSMNDQKICIGLAWSTDFLHFKAHNDLTDQEFNLVYTHPKEGSLMWFDQFVIPKDAQNVDAALKFLNFYMDPYVNARSQNYLHSSSNNIEAQKFLSEDVLNNYHNFLKPNELKTSYLRRPYTREASIQIQKIWAKFTEGKKHI